MLELYVLVTVTCSFTCPMIKLQAYESMTICEIKKERVIDETNPVHLRKAFCVKVTEPVKV